MGEGEEMKHKGNRHYDTQHAERLPLFLSCPLQQHDSQASITVASCVSALEPENDTFMIRVSQRIRCIPVWPLLGSTKITGDPT
jgi:hypothetical protein